MSIQLANADGIIDQVASNQGYSDLIGAVEDVFLPALQTFLKRGFTTAVDRCIADLGKLAESDGVDDDVAETAHGLARAMKGEAFVILTDGTSLEGE